MVWQQTVLDIVLVVGFVWALLSRASDPTEAQTERTLRQQAEVKVAAQATQIVTLQALTRPTVCVYVSSGSARQHC